MRNKHFKSDFLGYSYLLKKYELRSVPNWHTSKLSGNNSYSTKVVGDIIEETYPVKYWPGDTAGDHLEFALKYDGVNLGILKAIFEKLQHEEVADYILSKPTGKYSRCLWFFYEFLTGEILPLENVKTGNYVKALDPDKYFALESGVKSRRHRVENNLLGPAEFCPVVRLSDKLKSVNHHNIKERCQQIVNAYDPDILRRALSYLYIRETKSSFEIEKIKPDAKRAERFASLLQTAEQRDYFKEESLIDLQNRIVDPRFAARDFRESQNYVGQTVSYQSENIHYICPKPEDISGLMKGILECHKILKDGSIPPVIHAALIAYGFVFLHPFEDGNGRIHRFLIHNILSLRGLVPKGMMFPVSAVLVKQAAEYDNSLEKFSRPLMEIIDFQLDEDGIMTVDNETSSYYQYMDLTAQTEALYEFVKMTIEYELPAELNFLVNYDKTKRSIQEIVDMPDRLIDLFIRVCLQNNGRLSSKKKASHFAFLRDDEQISLEQAVKKGYLQ